MTESILWATEIINYIDDIYEDYMAGKFGKDKSWHITTKLAIHLITEVGKMIGGGTKSLCRW